MRWIYEKKKMICAAAAIVLAVLVTGVTAEKKGMLAQAKIASVQKRMAKEVFRFHVLANSDSEEDQELKMKVKGEIIASSPNPFLVLTAAALSIRCMS